MSRPFRPDTGAYVSSRVLAELARLWDQAVHYAGHQVTQDRLASEADVPKTTVNSWATGRSLPRDVDQLAKVGDVLSAWAREKSSTQRVWAQFLTDDQDARNDCRAAVSGSDTGIGWALGQMRDPFVLNVHRPITLGGTGALPPLPPYVRRAHDEWLAKVVDRAAAGDSAMAVLVADSSAGKTRALWEALGPLRRAGGWRLWHPFDPTGLQAALDRVGPRTVVWLNETQEYLEGGGGEQVAVKLRSLLTDPARAPVLVLGTLWRGHYADLARGSISQVARLLDGTVIEVPEVFTDADLGAMKRAAKTDGRLAAAVEYAEDGHITQYLAGALELLTRFDTAPTAAKAVIWAAMDARRMGHRIALPEALLQSAAMAYLTDTQLDQLGEDWLEQALDYTSQSCKGVRGPITRIRFDRSRHRTVGRLAAERDGVGPLYRLADFLEQHGRRHRADQIPPIGFWAAAAHAHPGDLRALGDAAWARGLYRDATQLHKHATAHGDFDAAVALVAHLHTLYPADLRPAHYAAMHVAVNDPNAVGFLLNKLREVEKPVGALLARNLAAHVALDDPESVSYLLDSLWKAGADEQFTTLTQRAVAHVALTAPSAVSSLLGSLWRAGADGQFAALAERAVTEVAFDASFDVIDLLDSLWKAGAEDHIATLLARDPATHVPLAPSSHLPWLLAIFRRMGADEQFAVLAERAAADVALDDPEAVAWLLDMLRGGGRGRTCRRVAGS